MGRVSKFTKDQKAAAVALAEKETQAIAAAKYGVGVNTIARWTKKGAKATKKAAPAARRPSQRARAATLMEAMTRSLAGNTVVDYKAVARDFMAHLLHENGISNGSRRKK